jgi:RNA polymerase sigma factor (sigma-70 family)
LPTHGHLDLTRLSARARQRYADAMESPDIPGSRWPAHVARATIALRGARPAARPEARAALWPLLHAALFASLRAQAGRVASVRNEDVEDMASQKALELLLQAEEGSWDPCGRADHEVAGYLAKVARNALIDLARRRGREAPEFDDAEAWAVAIAESVPEPARPEDLLVAREFARALRDCSAKLAPRARSAWFRRVFLERPSREIAARLGVNVAHVDVIVQRARATLRECMQARGHPDAELKPGSFVEIWSALAGGEPVGGAVDEQA